MDFWPVFAGYVLGAIILILIMKATFAYITRRDQRKGRPNGY